MIGSHRGMVKREEGDPGIGIHGSYLEINVTLGHC